MRTLMLGAMAALLVSVEGLAAQTVSLDLRGVAAVTWKDLVDADLGPGLGFGAVVAVRVQPHVHLYGGWDWVRFDAESSFAGAHRDFEETGYTFGARFEHPFASGDVAYRLEAGGVPVPVLHSGTEGRHDVVRGHPPLPGSGTRAVAVVLSPDRP